MGLSKGKIGVLSGGGDSAGINAAFFAVAQEAQRLGYELMGIEEGWAGMVEGRFTPLGVNQVRAYMDKAGTILGTSRTNPFRKDGALEKIRVRAQDFAGIVAIGGNDTLGVAHRLVEHLPQTRLVGIPQTIDNDVPGSEYCIGFDTAVHQVVEGIRNVRSTCLSHREDIVVEVMGRESGWLAALGGLAAGAEFILLPEVTPDLTALYRRLRHLHSLGQYGNIIVVAEGVRGIPRTRIEEGTDAFGHEALAGVGYTLRDRIAENLGRKTRAVVLGYFQRGGTPTAQEILTSLRLGQKAVEAIDQGKTGRMIGVVGGQVCDVDLALADGKRLLDEETLSLISKLTEF